MKKTVLFIALQLISFLSFSQAPGMINYQGVVRDASGVPISNQLITLKFELKQGATTVFTETQTSVPTNSLGLFSTAIGKINTGGLNTVNWQAGITMLEVSVDINNGTSFVTFSQQQLVSVPYALNASSVPATYTNNVLSIGANTFTLSSSPQTSITTTSGIATVTSAGTNTFDINVPAPVYNAATGDLSTGTSTTNITPVLSLSGNTLTAGPLTNTLVLPVAVTPTITGNGATTVSGTYPTLTVSSAVTTLTGAGTTTVTGTAPDYTITTPAQITPTITGDGIANVTTTTGNDFTVSVVSPTISGTGAATVTGTYPNFTVNSPVTTLTGAGTTTVTGTAPDYTIATPAQITQSIVPSGIVTVTSSANSFTIDAPAPVYNAATGDLTSGSSSTNITPTLSLSGNTLTVGPASNTVILPVAATPTINGTGATTVTGTYPTLTVNTPATSLTGAGTATVTGTAPDYTITTPAQITQSIVPSGIITVTSSANSFTIDAPATTLTGSGSATVTGTSPNYTISTPMVAPTTITATSGIATVTSAGTNTFDINVPAPVYNTATGDLTSGTSTINITPALSISGNTITAGPSTNTIVLPAAITPTINGSGIANVTPTAGNNFTVSVISPTITGTGATTVSGTYPTFTVNSSATTLTGAGTATVTGTAPDYTIATPAQTTQTIVPSGIVTVTSSANSFTIDAPAPVYNTATGNLTTGTSTTNITQAISISGNTITSGPATNSIVLPASVTPTITGTGATNVTGTYPTLTVNTPATTLTGAGTATVTGTAPDYTITTPAQITPTVTGTGLATVTSPASNSFEVDVPVPTYTAATGILAFGSNTLNTTPSLSFNSGTGILSSGPATNSVNIGLIGWKTTGNAGTVPATNFLGTTDAQPLIFKTNNTEVMRILPSGMVGIGTTPYDSKLEISRNATSTYTYALRSTLNYAAGSSGGGHSSAGFFTNNFSGNGGTQILSAVTGYLNLSGSGNSQYATAGWFNAVSTSGTHTNAHGIFGTVELNGSTVTNAYAGRFEFLGSQPAANAYGVYIGTVNGTNKWSLYTADATAPSYFAGSVGIGVTPASKLQVNGDISVDVASGDAPNRVIGFPTASPGNHGSLTIQAKSNSTSGTLFAGGDLLLSGGNYNHGSAPSGGYGGNVTIRTGRNVYNNTGGSDIIFQAGGNTTTHFERMRIAGNTGYVGIGTNAPSANLHVAGTTRLVDGTQGAGKVLTSDATGNASWQAPAVGSKLRSIVLDASTMDLTAPLSTATKVQLGSWERPAVQMADGVTQRVQVSVPIPRDWNGVTSLTVTVLYSGTVNTGDFVVNIGFSGIGLNQNINNAPTFSNTYNSPVSATTGGLMEVSSVLTTVMVPATTRSLHLRIQREGGNGADTAINQMYVHGIRIDYMD